MKAYRIWNKLNMTLYYVAQVPGDGGKDWGYTEDPKQAILLNKYWQRRFNADCRHVGVQAQFSSSH